MNGNFNKILIGLLSTLWLAVMSMGAYMYTSMDTRVTRLENSVTDIKVMIGGRDWARKEKANESLRELLEELNNKVVPVEVPKEIK